MIDISIGFTTLIDLSIAIEVDGSFDLFTTLVVGMERDDSIGIGFLDELRHLVHGLGHVRRTAGEDLVEHDAEAVDVGSVVDGTGAAELFRRGVDERP